MWIPASVMRAMWFALDESIDVREEAGRILIEQVRQKTFDLRKLLKAIPAKNQPKAIDFGPPQGKAVW